MSMVRGVLTEFKVDVLPVVQIFSSESIPIV